MGNEGKRMEKQEEEEGGLGSSSPYMDQSQDRENDIRSILGTLLPNASHNTVRRLVDSIWSTFTGVTFS